jgi:myo-inositol 2-dehydrogenase / D-chiro-inositol 1-dehydrogenase
MTRLAIIGCGRVAREVHLPLLARRKDVDVVAVADPDARARAAVTTLAPNASGFDAWRSLLDDAPLDAVIIASPPATHADIAVAALDIGCHVYIEKPMAVDPHDAYRIVRAWRRSGRAAMVGFNYRFNPLQVEAADLVRSGTIGDVTAVRTVFTRPGGALPDWQATPAGGGPLFDLATHHLDLIRMLTGLEVASIGAALSGDGAGHTASIAGTLTNGASVQVLVSFGSIDDDRVDVHGTSGWIGVDRYRSTRPILRRAGAAGRAAAVLDVVRSTARAGYLVRKMRSPWHEPSHAIALDAFLAATRGRPSPPDPEDGLVNVQAVAAAREAARTGRVVTLNHVPEPAET